MAGDDTLRSTIVALAFSGGGTRAAAFSFGVLKGLSEVEAPGGGAMIDQIRFVSGVSGGSVTAAYFGLKGRSALSDFEARFLYRDAEESLRTQVYSVGNMMRAMDGGVNDRSGLPTWLRNNLFGNATLKDLSRPGRPVVWINASDIYAKTPFVFEPVTFAAICSDWESYPISDAVAASAAVPIVFAPVVVQNWSQKCGLQAARRARGPGPFARHLADRQGLPQGARGLSQRRQDQIRQAARRRPHRQLGGFPPSTSRWPPPASPWRPMTKADAISVSNFQFIVVDAGRNVAGDWTKTLEGPNAQELLDARRRRRHRRRQRGALVLRGHAAADEAVGTAAAPVALLALARGTCRRCAARPRVGTATPSPSGSDRVSFEDLGTARAAPARPRADALQNWRRIRSR